MITNKTNPIPMLKFLLVLAFSKLLFAQNYVLINSALSGNLANTNYGIGKYTILVPGRTYTLTAAGGDTRLYLWYPGGGYSSNEDWGGTTDPKFSQISFTTTATSGTTTINVYSSAGNINFILYLTDVSPCSSSCTSKLFLRLLRLILKIVKMFQVNVQYVRKERLVLLALEGYLLLEETV